jgi:uncharacterized protein YcbX
VLVSEIQVSGLNVYPIKSCGRVELEEAQIVSSGLEYDRLFMLIDKNNNAITQRNLRLAPKLVQIQPEFGTYSGGIIGGKNNGRLHMQAGDFGSLDFSLFLPPHHRDEDELAKAAKRKKLDIVEAKIHGTTAVGAVVGEEENEFFSEYLGEPVRLIRAVGQNLRQIEQDRQIEGASPFAGFADGYPILLVNQASHDEISSHPAIAEEFEDGLQIDRWRAGIEVTGDDLEAFDEDKWRKIKVGTELSAWVAKPCIRCVIPQTDQQTGEVANSVKTALLETRFGSERGKDKKGSFLGQNLIIVKAGGKIALGDILTVEEAAEESNIVLMPHAKTKRRRQKMA